MLSKSIVLVSLLLLLKSIILADTFSEVLDGELCKECLKNRLWEAIYYLSKVYARLTREFQGIGTIQP